MPVSDLEEQTIRAIQATYKSLYYPKHKYQRILQWLRKVHSQIEDLEEEKELRYTQAALELAQVEFKWPVKLPTSRQKDALDEIMDVLVQFHRRDLTVDQFIVPEAWRPEVLNGGLYGVPALGGQLLPMYNPRQRRISRWYPDRTPMIHGIPVQYSHEVDKVIGISSSLGRTVKATRDGVLS